MHGGAINARHGAGRRPAWEEDNHHHQQPEDAVSAGQGQSGIRISWPNALFSCAGVTYVHSWAGLVYVAFAIDAFARRIVGWKVSTSATASVVLDALEQAIHVRRPDLDDGLIHHSDRGVQYLAMNHTQRLAEAKLVPSAGSVGDAYDKAQHRQPQSRKTQSLAARPPSRRSHRLPSLARRYRFGKGAPASLREIRSQKVSDGS